MILKFILIQYGFIIISDKYNLKEKLTGWGNLLALSKFNFFKIIGRFLYEVSECKFCTYHHLGVFSLVFFVTLYGFEWEFLVFPFMGASFLIMYEKTIK